jgi:hypothetical protein
MLRTFDASSSDGCPCNSMGNRGYGYGDVAFLAGHAWVTTGSSIWELAADGERVVWSHSLGHGLAPGRVLAVRDRLIVETSPTSTQQLLVTAGAAGARLGDTGGVVDGTQQLLGVQGGDTLLISTGDDVEQWRASGTDLASHALFDSTVGHAVALPNGDVVASTVGTEDGGVAPALWLATAKAGGLLCERCVRKIAAGLAVVSLAVNPAGGVDFVADDGTAGHWQP